MGFEVELGLDWFREREQHRVQRVSEGSCDIQCSTLKWRVEKRRGRIQKGTEELTYLFDKQCFGGGKIHLWSRVAQPLPLPGLNACQAP